MNKEENKKSWANLGRLHIATGIASTQQYMQTTSRVWKHSFQVLVIILVEVIAKEAVAAH